MTPTQIAALKTELTTDPAGVGYAPLVAAGAVGALRIALTEPTRAVRRPVPIEVLSAYCAAAGITGSVRALLRLDLGQEIAPGVPMTLQILALLYSAETLLVTDYRMTTADLDSPAMTAALDGLLAVGVVSAGQRTEILALADTTVSRAAGLGWDWVTDRDVVEALTP